MKTHAVHKGRTILDRSLSLFADVRRGEGPTVFLLMLNIFLLLAAYYLIKPVREALILGSGGAELKAYTGAAQAFVFLLIVPVYSSFASRVNRLHLINGVTGFFISNLAIFYFLAKAQVPIAIPFFIWVGLFNLMLVTQVWALANDVYRQDQGRRLFAIVGIGSSLGAIFGAYLAGVIFESFGPYRMMLLSGAILSVCIALTTWIHRRETNKVHETEGPASADAPISGQGGFQLVLSQKYLLLIALMVLLTNLVNTNGEFMLGKVVKQHAEAIVSANPNGLSQEAFIGKFYSDFYFWVNVVGAAVQLFAVSRLMKYFGISIALFFLPIIALGSYTLLAFAPLLSFVRVAKILENSTDYSIQNTARHALFLRTDRDAKYKAKTAIDNFFWRMGDALSALVVFVGSQLAFGLQGFAVTNIVLVFVWLVGVAAIVRLRKSSERLGRPVQTAPLRQSVLGRADFQEEKS